MRGGSRGLIGRDAQLGVLRRALDDTRAGRGAAVFARGESGAGRTRLLTEASRWAVTDELVVLRGRTSAIGPAVPFRALSEALLSLTRSSATVPELQQDRLGAYRLVLGRLLPEWRVPGHDPQDHSLVVLAEAVLRLLTLAGRDRGCLLLLDDLQDADAETLAVVEYLADNLADQPVMLAAAVPDGPCAALDLARAAVRRGSATLLDLPRLGPDDLRALAAGYLGCPPPEVPSDVVDLVGRASAGNPALAEDVLGDLLAGGRLLAGPHGWQLTSTPATAVPPSLSRRLAPRLDAEEPAQQQLLLAAAAFGERFPLDAVQRITGLTDRDLLRRLNAGLAGELSSVDGQDPDWYQFRHPLTAEALLALSTPAQRAELAGRAASALEDLHPGLPGPWCQLAAALQLRAGHREQAGVHLLEAGRRALDEGAVGSAAELVEQALPLLAGTPQATRAQETLVQALAESGRIDRALAMLGDLDRLGGGLDRSRLAALHTRLAWAAVVAARPDVGGEQIEAARRCLGPDPDPADAAAVDVVAAHLLLDGDAGVAAAEAMARRAAEVGEAAGRPAVACQAWQLLGTLVRHRDPAEATACLEHSRQLAIRHGLATWELHALVRLGNDDAVRVADLRRLRQVRRLAWEAGAVTAAHQAEASLAFYSVLHDDCDEAGRIVDQLLATTVRLHLTETAGHLLQTRALAAAHRGQRRDLDRTLTELRALGDGSAAESLKVTAQARSICALLEEDRETAVRALALTRDNPAAAMLNPLSGRDGLALLLQALQPDAGRSGTPGHGTPERDDPAGGTRSGRQLPWNLQFGLLAEAVLAGRAGRSDAADAAVRSAREASRPYPLGRHLGLRLVAEAALADGWGDPAGWLREAEEYFHATGIAPVAGSCRSLLRRAGATVGQRRDGVGEIPAALRRLGVTVREFEVLTLLGRRLGNREIAERLHLSPRTVEKHVASLLARTGLPNRVALAELAARHDRD